MWTCPLYCVNSVYSVQTERHHSPFWKPLQLKFKKTYQSVSVPHKFKGDSAMLWSPTRTGSQRGRNSTVLSLRKLNMMLSSWEQLHRENVNFWKKNLCDSFENKQKVNQPRNTHSRTEPFLKKDFIHFQSFHLFCFYKLLCCCLNHLSDLIFKPFDSQTLLIGRLVTFSDLRCPLTVYWLHVHTASFTFRLLSWTQKTRVTPALVAHRDDEARAPCLRSRGGFSQTDQEVNVTSVISRRMFGGKDGRLGAR